MRPTRQHPNRNVQESESEVRDRPDPMREFAQMLAEAMQHRPPPVEAQPARQPAPYVPSFKDFKMVGPPEFQGTLNPIEAQTWIEEIEKIFEVARVADEQKTSFATFMMKGEANYWWKANKGRAGDEVIPWERFKELFFENYFPENVQQEMEVKFLELKQGSMSVAEYAAKFNELARFAPHQVDTEARKARRFELGLEPWVQRGVAVLKIKNFADLLERAIIAEGGNEAVTRFNQERKRGQEGPRTVSSGGSNPNKRKWHDSQPMGGSQSGSRTKQSENCRVCGKSHVGECLKGENICFSCGQSGHIAPRCPIKQKGRCFSCGSPNHQMKECPKRRRDAASGNQNNNNNNSSSNNRLRIGGADQPSTSYPTNRSK